MVIRKAQENDCLIMSKMINDEASKGLMLPKTKEQLRDTVHMFFVATERGQVIGCCGYKVWEDEWVEIISLVVNPAFQGRGIGSKLVEACLSEAKEKRYNKFFTVSLRPRLFGYLGFKRVYQMAVPKRVWDDCALCPKNTPERKVCCNENTLLLIIKGKEE